MDKHRKFIANVMISRVPSMIEQLRDFPGAVPECPESDLMINLFILIEEHYRIEHGVDFYLKQLHTSYYYLNSRCRYYFGKSLNELVEERLFKESCSLLSFTLTSVKIIAYELGFSDPSNFVRFFRRFAGNSPARFRRMGGGLQISPIVELTKRRDDEASR